MDSSHANNIGTARFINDFFKDPNICPHRYPRVGRTGANGGEVRAAVDGFPIRLFINGKEMGIYTFNIDRYAFNNLGFSGETSAVAYEIGTNSSLGSAAFMTDDWDNIASEFEYRYHNAGGEEMVTVKSASQNEDGSAVRVLKYGLHDQLQRLVSFVYSATDEEFRGSEGREHLSIEHFIDYFLLTYFFGKNYAEVKSFLIYGETPNGTTPRKKFII